MNRRHFLSLLSALPVIGKWMPPNVVASARPSDYVTTKELAAFYRAKQLEIAALVPRAPFMIDPWTTSSEYRGLFRGGDTLYHLDDPVSPVTESARPTSSVRTTTPL